MEIKKSLSWAVWDTKGLKNGIVTLLNRVWAAIFLLTQYFYVRHFFNLEVEKKILTAHFWDGRGRSEGSATIGPVCPPAGRRPVGPPNVTNGLLFAQPAPGLFWLIVVQQIDRKIGETRSKCRTSNEQRNMKPISEIELATILLKRSLVL